ncbi:hypothetical protein BS50DRAFT_586588 [Corynespora cassiicola Philippines]|uniref:Mid2 domain-containing protein n=1 Tax=Corynespora cassiicola Philippines TaxID=1448308 RepID=A0A2T2NVE6_CORCC|nr:hypothetical protein BS50DRAFT_586588 [Corynespora cassiicola Philippines]
MPIMRTIVMSSALFSGSYAALLATPVASDPTITAAPAIPVELLRKQNNDRFMGWVFESSEWMSRTCDIGGTYYQSGDYWRCCATTLAGCDVPIGCVAGSLLYSVTSGTQSIATFACTDVYEDAAEYTICNTGYMYENTADAQPATNVFCGISSLNWSYYRVQPETSSGMAMVIADLPTGILTTCPETPSSTPSSSPRSTPANPTSSASTSPSSEPESEGSESKAWIAGAVIGPLVGLALIGGIIFFCLRRKRKNRTAVPTNPPQMTAAAGTYPPPAFAATSDPKPPQVYENYSHVQQPQGGMAPVGVAKHDSWVPQSPQSYGSQSPNLPNSPYQPPPPGQGQPWQQQSPTAPQSGTQQMLAPQQQMYPGASPPASPQPQHMQPFVANGQPHQGAFSNELEGSIPQQQQAPRS